MDKPLCGTDEGEETNGPPRLMLSIHTAFWPLTLPKLG